MRKQIEDSFRVPSELLGSDIANDNVEQQWWNEKMGVITKDVEPAFTPPVNEYGMIQGEDTIEFNEQLTFGPAPTPLMTFSSTNINEPNTITICNDGKTAVTLNLETGGLEYGEDYIPSEAAEIFWDAVSANTPNSSLKKENDELKAKLKQMETKYGEHLIGQLKFEDGETLQWSSDYGDWVSVEIPSSEDQIRKGGFKSEGLTADDEWVGKIQFGNIDPDASVYYQDNSDNANYFWDLRAGMNNNDWAALYGEEEEPQTWLRILYDEDHNDPCAITVEDGGQTNIPHDKISKIESPEAAYARAMKLVE